jgi:hypothetical protein
MDSKILTPLPQSEFNLAPIREEMNQLYDEIAAHFGAALKKAVRIGELLVQLQPELKHVRGYEAWIDSNCIFSARTARDYVALFLAREVIEQNADDTSRLSIRAALQVIAHSEQRAGAAEANTSSVLSKLTTEGATEEEVEVELADRALLLIEADIGLIDELVSLIRAAKRAGKHIVHQKIGAFDNGAPLMEPFKELLRPTSKQKALISKKSEEINVHTLAEQQEIV